MYKVRVLLDDVHKTEIVDSVVAEYFHHSGGLHVSEIKFSCGKFVIYHWNKH